MASPHFGKRAVCIQGFLVAPSFRKIGDNCEGMQRVPSKDCV